MLALLEAWLKGRNELEKFELSPLQDVCTRKTRSTRRDRGSAPDSPGARHQAACPMPALIVRSAPTALRLSSTLLFIHRVRSVRPA